MKEEDKLSLLKDILLTDDREFAKIFSRRISALEATLDSSELLASKIEPIITERLNSYTKEIPKTLGSTITEALKIEIKNSKDEVVDALYPILGKMVKKYIAQEFKVLSEKINDRLNWRKRIGNKFYPSKKGQVESMWSSQIEQVLLIEQESGLLIGSYSKSKTIDEEMISGMLTAIKAFVEDAYLQKEQRLELIEYEVFKIQIQSFVTHYIAIIISGNYSLASKDNIQNIIFDFYESFTGNFNKESKQPANVNTELENFFSNAQV